MVRTKTGIKRRKRHKKIIKMAKGYWMARHRLIRRAKEAIVHAGQYAYVGRRLRKRDLRRLWIQRINAALTPYEISYNQFINGLKEAKIELDRKTLADLAFSDPATFKLIIDKVKKS